jgi:CheY-like chemotaxis protein
VDALIVDDSRGMRVIIKRTLRKADLDIGDIEDAGNGEEALEVLESGFDPDVIISDWKMPTMNGYELLKRVKEDYPDIPFGFITSQVSDERKEDAEGKGVDFFITKPFTKEGIHSVLEPFN